MARTVLNGSCFCGSAAFTVDGEPILSAYCHCTLCQRLTGCPFIHSIHFDEKDFEWTHEQPHEEKLDFFLIPEKPWKRRVRCKKCGVNVVSQNSKTGRCSVWAAVLERDEHGRIKSKNTIEATAHIFYGTRMLDIDDELSKWEGYMNESQRLQ